MPLLTRRSIIAGLASLITAPAIVRASSLMAVKRVSADELFTSMTVQQWDELIRVYESMFALERYDLNTDTMFV